MKVFAAGIIGATVAQRYYDYERHFDSNRLNSDYRFNYDRQWDSDRFPSYGWMNKNHYGNGYSNAWDNEYNRMYSHNDRPFYGPMNKNYYSPSYFNKYTNDYRFSRNFNSNDFDQYRFNEFNDFDRYNNYDNNRMFNQYNRYSDSRPFYGPMNKSFYYPTFNKNNQYRFNDFARYNDHHVYNNFERNFDFGNMNRWMHEFDSFHHAPQMSKLYQVAERHFWMNSGRSDNSEHLMSSVNQTESDEDSNQRPQPNPKTKSKPNSNPQKNQNTDPNPDTEQPENPKSLLSLWNGKWDKESMRAFRNCARGNTMDKEMMSYCHWRETSFFSKFAPRFISNEFPRFDTNNDKMLDKVEFKKAFAGFYANIGSSLVDIFDYDHNDVLEHSEIFDMYDNLRYLFNADMNSFHEISSHANYDNYKNSFSKAEMSEFAIMLDHRFF